MSKPSAGCRLSINSFVTVEKPGLVKNIFKELIKSISTSITNLLRRNLEGVKKVVKWYIMPPQQLSYIY